MSVEVAQDKTVAEVETALPALTGMLETRARAFYTMSCDMHRSMRLGSLAGRSERPGEGD